MASKPHEMIRYPKLLKLPLTDRLIPVIADDYVESEVVDDQPRELTKADVQREQIIRALRRHNGRRKDAAAELFMSERTLYRKIKELGIDDKL